MITDNPEIVPAGKAIAGYQEGNYEYKIKCPVCLSSTFFWRDEPFQTLFWPDKPTPGDLKIVNGVPYRYVKAGENIIVSKSE